MVIAAEIAACGREASTGAVSRRYRLLSVALRCRVCWIECACAAVEVATGVCSSEFEAWGERLRRLRILCAMICGVAVTGVAHRCAAMLPVECGESVLSSCARRLRRRFSA